MVGVQPGWLGLGPVEDVGPDDHARATAAGDGFEVVERADEVLGVEREPQLFVRLAQSGVEEVAVGGVVAATGQGHVSGPGVAFVLGAPDEQHLDAAGGVAQDGRHSSLLAVGEPGVGAGERLAGPGLQHGTQTRQGTQGTHEAVLIQVPALTTLRPWATGYPPGMTRSKRSPRPSMSFGPPPVIRNPPSPDAVPMARHIVPQNALENGDFDERMDYWAAKVFEEIPSASQARKLRKKGLLQKNGSVCPLPVTIQPGDTLTLYPRVVHRKLYEHTVQVVYEDDCMAVVVKDPGLRTSGNRFRTLVNCLPHNLQPATAKDALPWPHTVHRLDDRTGGLVAIAKTASANMGLGRIFQHRRVQKRYRAIVIGRLEGSGRVTIDVQGKAAASRYAARIHTPSTRFGWLTTVDLWPETGRTHQLRQHVAHLGHPILGDDLYTGDVPNLRHKGLHLWALALDLEHPLTGAPLSVEIDEPGKFDTRRAWELRRWLRLRYPDVLDASNPKKHEGRGSEEPRPEDTE